MVDVPVIGAARALVHARAMESLRPGAYRSRCTRCSCVMSSEPLFFRLIPLRAARRQPSGLTTVDLPAPARLAEPPPSPARRRRWWHYLVIGIGMVVLSVAGYVG